MPKHIQAIQMLLETSVFLSNTDQITNRRGWDTYLCSIMLANTSTTLLSILNHLSEANLEDKPTRDCVLLLQRILIPFQIRWDTVFFKDGKHRRWVRKKTRTLFKTEFHEVQEAVEQVANALGIPHSKDKGIA